MQDLCHVLPVPGRSVFNNITPMYTVPTGALNLVSFGNVHGCLFQVNGGSHTCESNLTRLHMRFEACLFKLKHNGYIYVYIIMDIKSRYLLRVINEVKPRYVQRRYYSIKQVNKQASDIQHIKDKQSPLYLISCL